MIYTLIYKNDADEVAFFRYNVERRGYMEVYGISNVDLSVISNTSFFLTYEREPNANVVMDGQSAPSFELRHIGRISAGSGTETCEQILRELIEHGEVSGFMDFMINNLKTRGVLNQDGTLNENREKSVDFSETYDSSKNAREAASHTVH